MHVVIHVYKFLESVRGFTLYTGYKKTLPTRSRSIRVVYIKLRNMKIAWKQLYNACNRMRMRGFTACHSFIAIVISNSSLTCKLKKKYNLCLEESFVVTFLKNTYKNYLIIISVTIRFPDMASFTKIIETMRRVCDS